MTLRTLLAADGHPAILLIRASVGAVFVSEGIQKFLYPAQLGVGRFAKIGFANAETIAPFVGTLEILCGLCVLCGLLSRLAALPLVAIMLTALITTKLPIWLGRDVGPFQVRVLEEYGFWAMAHEARTDWAMLLGALFLVIVGPGRWSLDAWLTRRFT
jgi:uncharacterized membrane protein YphA (DoxX/SURF4 family)